MKALYNFLTYDNVHMRVYNYNLSANCNNYFKHGSRAGAEIVRGRSLYRVVRCATKY